MITRLTEGLLKWPVRFYRRGKLTGGLDDVLGAGACPVNILRLFFPECNDPLAAYIDCIVVEAQAPGKNSMDRVILSSL